MNELDSKPASVKNKKENSEDADAHVGANGQDRILEDDLKELDPEEVASDTEDVLEGKEPGRLQVYFIPLLLAFFVTDCFARL